MPTNDPVYNKLVARFKLVREANDGWVRIACPTCDPHDAKKFKRYINLNNLFTKCFICEEALNLRELLEIPQDALRNEAPIISEHHEHPQARILPFKEIIPVHYLPKNHPAAQFLAKDHLTELERYWRNGYVGYIPYKKGVKITFEGSTYEIFTDDSIIFPVIEFKQLVGWQIRYIPNTPYGNKMQKMRYFHLFNKGAHLYNYEQAISHDSVVVTEGAKKAWKFPNGVATFGKDISDAQIRLLKAWDMIILFLDADPPIAQAKAQMLCEKFNANYKKCVNINPADHGVKSPDELPIADCQRIVREAVARYNHERNTTISLGILYEP